MTVYVVSYVSVPDKRRVSGQKPDDNRSWPDTDEKENRLNYSYKWKPYNYERKQK